MNCTLQVKDESPERVMGIPKAVFDLYDIITNELLIGNLRLLLICRLFSETISLAMCFSLLIIRPFVIGEREEIASWNILVRARNEGRLFSEINWPKDPESVGISSNP